ncbi:hypothetical protein LJY25_13245 [Hymenobacter sp. BT175]|uniref:hypothetical protein n=1 Tax=Hymenobacter translucens TaxID=2886507 RepID=UPI001D0F42B3|nr:hypothetical protein [Hymenobacter translucens]MCC2547415.1 hypothetical protein [Hymenobacter translucens]
MRQVLTTLLLLLIATASMAQIQHLSPAQIRAETRKALRDAREYDAKHKADYKESHLDVSRIDLKRGDGGQEAHVEDGRETYQFDNTGTPRVSDPTYGAARVRTKKKETKVPKE